MKKKIDIIRSLAAPVLAGILVMSTITGCGKTAEVVTTADNTQTEATEPVAPEVTEQPAVTEEVTPTPEPTPTKEAEPESVEESSEEESSEELTVDMTKVKAFDQAKTLYAVKNVNIRKGPGTDYDSVGMLKSGDTIQAIGQDAGGWYEIKYKDEIAFASNDFFTDEEPIVPEAAELPVQAAVPAQDQPVPAATQETVQAPVKIVTAPANVVIIGDSRCVEMRDLTGGGGCTWVCEKSRGYSWLESKALGQADESIGKGTKVVIALGVNDVENVSNYAALINAKAAEWALRGAKTYFVSVNPVWENPYVTEDQVVAFNSTLPGLLVGVRWIDTHSYLIANGYKLVDGMHYDDETNIRVFQAIVGSLR